MNKNEKAQAQEQAQEFSLVTTGETAPETMDGDTNFIVDLTSRTTQYCSMVAESAEDKAILYNAMNNPAFRLGDCINQTINVKDIFVEVVNCTNEQTGEVKPCPRIVLIDDKKQGYQCVSIGVFSAIKKLFGVYGEPHNWAKPVPLTVKQITKGERKMLTLNVAMV
nr:MAG: Single-stranded DNA-binding protein [Bacteriophage sp.]UWG00143.1 MAG: Single-stranded DNA-binding protein [Bacteriophage sp.]UWG11507.1 MAG: Single-stranded DNA-binding protein [Bacteriophage sp.]